jgi:hypothetical protein
MKEGISAADAKPTEAEEEAAEKVKKELETEEKAKAKRRKNKSKKKSKKKKKKKTKGHGYNWWIVTPPGSFAIRNKEVVIKVGESTFRLGPFKTDEEAKAAFFTWVEEQNIELPGEETKEEGGGSAQ